MNAARLGASGWMAAGVWALERQPVDGPLVAFGAILLTVGLIILLWPGGKR